MVGRLFVLCVLVVLSGCGPSGPERVDFSGTLTYQGKPVTLGALELIPRTSGPVQPISVKDGAFSAKGQYGVIVGKYQVVFHSYTIKDQGSAEQDGAQIPEMMTQVEMLPKKYSTSESTVELNLESGMGSLDLKYDLE